MTTNKQSMRVRISQSVYDEVYVVQQTAYDNAMF